MQRFMFLFAGAMVIAGSVAAVSAGTIPKPEAGVLAAGGGVLPAAARRCTPSRCGCKDSRTTFCTRDCRRDIRCACVRGRYVCKKV